MGKRVLISCLVALTLIAGAPAAAQSTKPRSAKKASGHPAPSDRARSESCRAFVAMIEKGFGANPWGTPKDELRIGTEMLALGDPRREKLEKMKFGTFEYRGRQEDSNSWSYRENGKVPPSHCLEYKDVKIAVDGRFGEFSRLVFGGIPGSERAVMGFMKELLSGRNGYRAGTREFLGEYEVLHTANLEVTVGDWGGPDGVFVEVTHKYENPCPQNADKDPLHGNEMYRCGVLGHPWGELRSEVRDRLVPLGPGDGSTCLECENFEVPTFRGRMFLKVTIEKAHFAFDSENRLTEVTVLFKRRDYEAVANEAVRLFGNLQGHDARDGGGIWDAEGMDIALASIEDLRNSAISGITFTNERLRKK